MPEIHPTAIVSNEATLAGDVVVGAYALIGAGVTVGAGTQIGPFTRIEGPVTIGERNRIVGQSSLGTPPQDLKFKGERTELVIGNDNTIREFCTFNRGTSGGGGITTIGSNSFFMAYSHVAHDCHLGSERIFPHKPTPARPAHCRHLPTICAFS